MTLDQAVDEILGNVPSWTAYWIDPDQVVRKTLEKLQETQPATSGPIRGWWARRALRKTLTAQVRKECQPKSGCIPVLIGLSPLWSVIVEAAIAAVVEACVYWWMEHKVLPRD